MARPAPQNAKSRQGMNLAAFVVYDTGNGYLPARSRALDVRAN